MIRFQATHMRACFFLLSLASMLLGACETAPPKPSPADPFPDRLLDKTGRCWPPAESPPLKGSLPVSTKI